MTGHVDGVGTARDEGGREGLYGLGRPGQHGADADAEAVGQLAGAAEQLQADLGRHAVVLLDDDPDVAAARSAVRAIQGCAPRSARARAR